MNEMTTADLSRRIAEIVGDRGFFPERDCPGETHSVHGPDGRIARQGGCHENWHEDHGYYSGVGELCPRCLFAAGVEANATQEIDPSWHPEWRIQRGAPKPYATSPELLIPLVEQWFADHPGFGLEITVAGESGQLGRYLRIRTPGGTVLGNSRFSDVTEMRARIARDASEFTQALAEIWLAVSERWGRDA